jgi:hypothetical protein
MQNKVLLHLSDWNYEDKYYHMPKSVLKEFATRIKNANTKEVNLGGAWDWLIEQQDAGLVERCDASADHTADEYFLDWETPKSCVAEWEECWSFDIR